MSEASKLSPPAFCNLLAEQGIQRFCLVPDEESGRLTSSHPVLQPLADLLGRDRRDFDAHEGIFVQVAPESGVLQGAFVHRTCRGQAAGGVRFWSYETIEDYLRDGLRLAKGMTQKNALAGLWWGGGKGVMARGTGQAEEADARRLVYAEYGAFISSLNGCYVTAEDVGTCVADMGAVFSQTRYTTCIPAALGGSGNPSVPTARGVLRGMQAALRHAGTGPLENQVVAVQGLGHVGGPLVDFLHAEGVRHILATDIDPGAGAAVRGRHPDLDFEFHTAAAGDFSFFSRRADILSPNATGAILNPRTIPIIEARIVCGAANNQLEDATRDDRLLAERGILYMPDFLVNRMGIVNCADEQYGAIDSDPAIERHLGDAWEGSILNLSMEILRQAEQSGRTPQQIAVEMADRRSLELHPIWGHRGRAIIRSLVRREWAH